MNKKIKKMWITALRSGKYKQGKNRLVHGNQNGTSYCCLGVLSDLAVQQGVCSRRTAFKGNEFLVDKVKEWAGLDEKNPYLQAIKVGATCSDCNDGGDSFKTIAKKIQISL